MQCFQKDPNLRVSARKLLKHPWIVNARRSDSVVPKKPTEYDEAVKSVQQWNEALKSPNAASLRRTSRPISSSPVPGRREPPQNLATPAKGGLGLSKPNPVAEQFRSPDNTSDDNWDDDFTSAISPSALKLPHLKPHDNFGGLLSAEKLKAFASFETVTEDVNWDNSFEGQLQGSLHVNEADSLETIRPFNPRHANASLTNQVLPSKPITQKPAPSATRRSAAFPASHQKQALPRSETTVSQIVHLENVPVQRVNNGIAPSALINISPAKTKVSVQRWKLYEILKAYEIAEIPSPISETLPSF